jgi:16S rRNA processing protein RimM
MRSCRVERANDRTFADLAAAHADLGDLWILGGHPKTLAPLAPLTKLYKFRIALCEGITDRDAALGLSGWWVQIARSALPPLEQGEHYRDDLVGFEVANAEGVVLGKVDYFSDLPAGPVMVVKGEREHWVPASPKHLLKIEAAARRLIVDWPAELE